MLCMIIGMLCMVKHFDSFMFMKWQFIPVSRENVHIKLNWACQSVNSLALMLSGPGPTATEKQALQ